MRANRAFRCKNDDAVSPVVAVIMLVGVTVVVSAGVYVWSTGFTGRDQGASGTFTLTSNGNVDERLGENPQKRFVVVTQTPGLYWTDVAWTIDGVTAQYSSTLLSGADADEASYCYLADTGDCFASPEDAGTVDAGDSIVFEDSTLGDSRILAVNAGVNSVMMQITVS